MKNAMADVLKLQKAHAKTWRNKPTRVWIFGLLEEVAELILSLLKLHKHDPYWELMQIAAICINWMDMILEEKPAVTK